jgi:hypothetical protein
MLELETDAKPVSDAIDGLRLLMRKQGMDPDALRDPDKRVPLVIVDPLRPLASLDAEGRGADAPPPRADGSPPDGRGEEDDETRALALVVATPKSSRGRSPRNVPARDAAFGRAAGPAGAGRAPRERYSDLEPAYKNPVYKRFMAARSEIRIHEAAGRSGGRSSFDLMVQMARRGLDPRVLLPGNERLRVPGTIGLPTAEASESLERAFRQSELGRAEAARCAQRRQRLGDDRRGAV